MGMMWQKLMNASAAALGPVVIERTATPAGVAHSSLIATYTSQSIGTEESDRVVVVTVHVEKAAAEPLSATIDYGSGATAMSSTATGVFGALYTRIFYLAVPTGTTATIAVTYGANPSGSQNTIVVYKVTGANATPTASGADGSTDMDASDPLTTGSVTIPTDGGFIAGISAATATNTFTWSNATEDVEANGGNYAYSTATSTTGGTVTVTCTGVSGNEDGALAYIIFEPA